MSQYIEDQIYQLCAVQQESTRLISASITQSLVRNYQNTRIAIDFTGLIGESVSIILLIQKSILDIRKDLVGTSGSFKFVLLQNDTFLLEDMLVTPNFGFCLTYTRVHPDNIDDYTQRNECNFIQLNEDGSCRYVLSPIIRKRNATIKQELMKIFYHPSLIQNWIENNNALEEYKPEFVSLSILRQCIKAIC